MLDYREGKTHVDSFEQQLPNPLVREKCSMWNFYYVASAKRRGGVNVFNIHRGLWGCVSQEQLFSQSSIFTSPQTQFLWNMWFWSAHVQDQLKHQYTMITHYTAAMRTTCQIKPECPDTGPCFESSLAPWEHGSQACKQWRCIHSHFFQVN